jgi:hypothetical protein
MIVKYIPHQLIIINFLLKLHLCLDCAIIITMIIIIIIIIIVATSQFYIVFCMLSAYARHICRFKSQCINLFMWECYKSKLFWTYSISRIEKQFMLSIPPTGFVTPICKFSPSQKKMVVVWGHWDLSERSPEVAFLNRDILQRHRAKLPLQREISAPSTKVDLPGSKISPYHLPQLPFQTMR